MSCFVFGNVRHLFSSLFIAATSMIDPCIADIVLSTEGDLNDTIDPGENTCRPVLQSGYEQFVAHFPSTSGRVWL